MLSKRFQQHALAFLNPRPHSEWEWLFVMQHHGVPTRLLDWTENPLAALFFAAEKHHNVDGALWCLLPVRLNQSANVELELQNDIPGFDHEDVLKAYLPSSLRAERATRNKPIAAIAARNTPRMQAQSGVFTIFHRDLGPLDGVGDKKHVWRYIIPKKAKPKILRELSHLHIARLSLFPELASVGEYVKGLIENG